MAADLSCRVAIQCRFHGNPRLRQHRDSTSPRDGVARQRRPRANGDFLQLVYCLSKGQRLPALQQGRVWSKGWSLRLRKRSQGSHVDLDVLTNALRRAHCTLVPSLLTKWERTQRLGTSWHSGLLVWATKTWKGPFFLQGPVGFLSSLSCCLLHCPLQCERKGHRIPVTLVRTRRQCTHSIIDLLQPQNRIYLLFFPTTTKWKRSLHAKGCRVARKLEPITADFKWEEGTSFRSFGLSWPQTFTVMLTQLLMRLYSFCRLLTSWITVRVFFFLTPDSLNTSQPPLSYWVL